MNKTIVSGESTGFTPIGLSGIIRPDVDKETTSLLLVLFCLKLKYKDTSGKPCLLRVACDKSVAVNFLLGLPFLKKAKVTVCFESDRFHYPAFDGEDPFTISYCTPTLTTPKVLFHHSMSTSSTPYEKDVLDAIVSVMAAFNVAGVKDVARSPFPSCTSDDVNPERIPSQFPATLAPALRNDSNPNQCVVSGPTLDSCTSSDSNVIDVANPPPQSTFVAAVSVCNDVEALVVREVEL